MGKCTSTIQEIRFVFEAELTQVYARIDADGDCPLGVQGWHHKTYPASKNAAAILKGIGAADDPLLWSQRSPDWIG